MKKVLCLLLAMLLVLPLAVACGGNEEKPPVASGDDPAVSGDDPAVSGDDPAVSGDETDPATPGDETDPATPSDNTKLDTTNLDFGNADFHVVAFNWQAYAHYFFAEEESSDPMESAIYQRKQMVEDAIGVKLSHTMYTGYGDMYPAIDQNVGVGDDSIQLALVHCISGVANYASSGTLYPLEKLPNMNLDADWWNKEQMEEIRLGNSFFYGVNDYMIPTPYIMFFNKGMIEELNLEDPYTLVDNNQWTLEKFEEMARAAHRDTDNNGTWNEKDNYGFTMYDGSEILSFWHASEQYIGRKNDEGRLELVLNTEKAVDILETIASWTTDHLAQVSVSGRGLDCLGMDSDQTLFWLAALSEAEQLRDSDVEYGILPYPKYTADQENYAHLDWGGLMCVPTTIRDPEMVGATIELLAEYSGETVIPAYYDKVLDGQLAQDPRSSDMLDIIFDTVVYDPAVNYFGLSGSIFKLFYQPWFDAHLKGVSMFASTWQENIDAANQQIEDFYSALELTESLNDMMG